MLTWFGLFLLLRISNFLTCLSLTLLNLSCLIFSIKLTHLSRSTWVTKDTSLVLLWLPLSLLACIVLLIPLTLSCVNCLSALSIIFLALVLIFCLLLIGFSFILTGIKLCPMHYKVNILWFLWLLTFITFFSHRHNCCKASNPYFSLIFLCMFIILLINT